MEESWKEIDGLEEFYQISNLGRIKSLRKTNGVQNRIIKTHVDRDGYRVAGLTLNQKTINKRIARLIALAFIPNPSNLPLVNHKDGDKQNDSISNLEWCDFSYNTQHAYTNNLIDNVKGTRSHWAKLDELQARTILSLKDDHLSDSQIAKYFKVDTETVRKIHIGENWKHL